MSLFIRNKINHLKSLEYLKLRWFAFTEKFYLKIDNLKLLNLTFCRSIEFFQNNDSKLENLYLLENEKLNLDNIVLPKLKKLFYDRILSKDRIFFLFLVLNN